MSRETQGGSSSGREGAAVRSRRRPAAPAGGQPAALERQDFPGAVLVRHGQTEWSLSGRHTGLSDIPLTGRGERDARRLAQRLRGLAFAQVLVSPLRRAVRTCELAGFVAGARVDPDLLEWNYGEFEGRRTAEIRAERPGWRLFRDGCPGGESPQAVGERADRIIARIRSTEGLTLLVSSGHILRVLVARWLGLPPAAGSLFLLETASVSMLGYEHDRSEPVVRRWNDTGGGRR